MLRSKQLTLVLLLTLLPISVNAADSLKITGGSFAFLHPPVHPDVPDGYCFDPQGAPVGLLFNVASTAFDGELITKKTAVPFSGAGTASGCAYFVPVDGVAAEFSGAFTWHTADGELRGSFELQDFPTEYPSVYAAVIWIKFEGGTGKFQDASGCARAEGLDFPFGGINGDPDAAGVVANIVEGKIKFK